MSTPSIRELIDSCPTVGSLPSVYHRLTDVMNDPYSSAADFGAVVSEDTGLTARVLQLVNSAFYGFPSKLDSVTQALSIVGINQLHDLALGTSVLSMFEELPPDLVDMEVFWKHSLACGVAARVLAGQRRVPNVERFFVAGLLHDIGRLILYIGYPEGARAALERSRSENELLHVAERAVLGYDHAAVGHLLMQRWNLPASLQEPVGYHHDPRKAQRFPIETAAVHIADITAHALRCGNSGQPFIPPLSEAVWHRLELTDALPLTVINDIDQQFSAAVQAILQPETV